MLQKASSTTPCAFLYQLLLPPQGVWVCRENTPFKIQTQMLIYQNRDLSAGQQNGKRLTSEMSIAKRLCAWLFRSFSPQWITKCFVATSLKATSQVSKLVLVLFSAPSVLLPVGVQLSLPQRLSKTIRNAISLSANSKHSSPIGMFAVFSKYIDMSKSKPYNIK